MSDEESPKVAEDLESRASYTPPPEGAQVGPFHLVARLAGGTMSDVYLAHKISEFGFVRRSVIKRVKRNRPDFDKLQAMLLDEARAIACFDHPNLVDILDVGQDHEGAYLALEFVDGTDLRSVTHRLQKRREALPFELAAFVLQEVLRGLHHAHVARGPDGKSLNIVHRDVNGANVLITRSGHIKLADFGVVSMRHRIQEQTLPGLVKGKYAYLAPEYIAGEPCSVQTDIYSAGVLLFELLTGRECFRGSTAYEVMWQIVNKGVPLHRLEKESVPEDLIRVVQIATDVVPERRFETAEDFANALETWIVSSNCHATPWVLSAFFHQHELFPKDTDPVRPTVLPLANAHLSQEGSSAWREAPPIKTDSRALESEPTPLPQEMDWEQGVPPRSPPAMPQRPAAPAVTTGRRTDEFSTAVTMPSIPPPVRVKTDSGDLPLSGPPKGGVPPFGGEESSLGEVQPSLGAADPSSFEAESASFPKDTPSPVHASPPISPAPEGLQPSDASEPGGTGAPWSGKLEVVPGAEVLQRLSENKATGKLEFRCGLIWKRLSLREGRPLSIQSNMGMELIGEHLVKKGLVSRYDLERALSASQQGGGSLTAELLGQGQVKQEDLESALGSNISERLEEVFDWRWGTFDFDPHEVEDYGVQPSLDLEALIAEGLRRIQVAAEEEAEAQAGAIRDPMEMAQEVHRSTGKGRIDELPGSKNKR